MAIFKLINKYFIKSVVGLLCVFGLPLFFSLMFFAMGKNQFAISFPVVVTSGIMSVTLMIIPTLIIDLRKSLILKRIGTSQISTHHFVFILVMYFYFWIFVTIAYSFVLFAIISPIAIGWDRAWQNHFVGGTIYASLILGTMGIVVSVFIGTLCKNAMIASAISFIVIFFSMFTSGLLMPFSIIRQIDAMRILNYFLPFNWPMLMMQESWGISGFNLDNPLMPQIIVVSGNIWNWNAELKSNIFQFGGTTPLLDFTMISKLAKIWNIFAPYVVLTVWTTTIALAFKWTER